jgi:hypothetical protein
VVKKVVGAFAGELKTSALVAVALTYQSSLLPHPSGGRFRR